MALIIIEHEQHPDILEIIGLYELEQEINQLNKTNHLGLSFNVIDDYLMKNSLIKTYMCQEDKIQVIKDQGSSFKMVVQESYNQLLNVFNTMSLSIDSALPNIDEIEVVLDDFIRPALAQHAGNIKITYLENGILGLKLLGTCQGCAFSLMTLTSHVARILGMYFPALLVLHIQNDLIEAQ